MTETSRPTRRRGGRARAQGAGGMLAQLLSSSPKPDPMPLINDKKVERLPAAAPVVVLEKEKKQRQALRQLQQPNDNADPRPMKQEQSTSNVKKSKAPLESGKVSSNIKKESPSKPKQFIVLKSKSTLDKTSQLMEKKQQPLESLSKPTKNNDTRDFKNNGAALKDVTIPSGSTDQNNDSTLKSPPISSRPKSSSSSPTFSPPLTSIKLACSQTSREKEIFQGNDLDLSPISISSFVTSPDNGHDAFNDKTGSGNDESCISVHSAEDGSSSDNSTPVDNHVKEIEEEDEDESFVEGEESEEELVDEGQDGEEGSNSAHQTSNSMCDTESDTSVLEFDDGNSFDHDDNFENDASLDDNDDDDEDADVRFSEHESEDDEDFSLDEESEGSDEEDEDDFEPEFEDTTKGRTKGGGARNAHKMNGLGKKKSDDKNGDVASREKQELEQKRSKSKRIKNMEKENDDSEDESVGVYDKSIKQSQHCGARKLFIDDDDDDDNESNFDDDDINQSHESKDASIENDQVFADGPNEDLACFEPEEDVECNNNNGAGGGGGHHVSIGKGSGTNENLESKTDFSFAVDAPICSIEDDANDCNNEGAKQTMSGSTSSASSKNDKSNQSKKIVNEDNQDAVASNHRKLPMGFLNETNASVVDREFSSDEENSIFGEGIDFSLDECNVQDAPESSNINSQMDNLTLSSSLSNVTLSNSVVEKGKWNLGNIIGEGSFGVVHVGMNAVTGGLMAVKVLQIPSRSKHAMIEDLQREIDLMKSLNHPNIVRYLGAEEDLSKNILHIFQEWVPGGSVSSLLKKFGSFSIPVVRSYTTQVLKGLDYLHSNGIIHRDIKGGNILVSNDGVVKLADFGASKKVEAFGADPDKMMEELTMRGTPYFMAPEVFEEKYGPKADIWSVGGLIYQMATASPPWKDMGFKNPISLFFHLKSNNEVPKLPPLKATTYDEGDGHVYSLLGNAISRCFQRDPANRPSASMLLTHDFFGTTTSNSLKPMDQNAENEHLTSDSPGSSVSLLQYNSPSPQNPLTQTSEDEACDSSFSDSLCYSLTLPVPSPRDRKYKSTDCSGGVVDSSDWPQWARKIGGSDANPFARKSEKTNPFSR